MHKAHFEIEGFDRFFDGYTNGTHWNGWACPWFTKEVAKEITLLYNHDREANEFMVYYESSDRFMVGFMDEAYQGEDFTINDETIHLYPIGNGCWIWDDVADYQSKEAKVAYDYLIAEYETLNPRELYTVYHDIIGELDGYMSKQEIEKFVDGYMLAYMNYIWRR